VSFEVNKLTKTYGEKIVVDQLSFELKEPGVYALLGTNGAGKTTSIRMILGMLSKDSGEVLWNGKPMDATKENIGYLSEERGLYPRYRLMDQLLYFAKLKGMDYFQAKQGIEHWAKRLEVEEYFRTSKTAEQLSKGNQQKIQLMAALISNPELLILDEPLSGLDPINTDLFKSIIREEIAKGKYLIMSSHQMATIEEFCKDITILNRGKTVLQGDLNEIKKEYGRINLIVKCDETFTDIIAEQGLTVINETMGDIQIRVSEEKQAHMFLKELLEKNKKVVRFELREPSLHEIFIEKAGKTHE